jgi:tripartite-type tricarboxylate transporter receptor subunit TctC
MEGRAMKLPRREFLHLAAGAAALPMGYPQIEGDSWVGILVPAGTPAEIIAFLYRESTKILAQSDMKERLAALGYDLVASTPKEFATRIVAEIEMWAKVIQAANIKPQ